MGYVDAVRLFVCVLAHWATGVCVPMGLPFLDQAEEVEAPAVTTA